MIGKVLFLIENRHFLIRKCHFGIGWNPYVGHVRPNSPPFLIRRFPMIRRKLLIATAIIASVVLTACSDMTGPKSTACPILNGSSICMTH